jgi:hypothetical protein
MVAVHRLGALVFAALLTLACSGPLPAEEQQESTPETGIDGWGDDDDDDDAAYLDGGDPEDVAIFGDDDAGFVEDDAGTPAEDAGGPPCTKKTYHLKHLQASMEHFDPPAELKTSIDTAFGAGAHTISWTEIETATQVDHIQAKSKSGWATFWPSGKAEVAAKNAVPISWRTDTFSLDHGQSYFASEGLAGVSPSRWVTRVWLKHIASGKIISRVAHHSVSGVDGAGKDPVEWRRKMHAKDIAKFKAVMLLDTVPVIGSADFNTTRLRTLLGTTFRYDVPATGGSHGSRLIDWIVRRPHPDHAFVDVQFVSLGPSDHRGVRASYDYTPPCK